LNAFLLDLEAGKFDPDLNDPEESTSPVKENVSGDTAATADANGTAVAAEEIKVSSGGDDETQFAIEADDDTGDHDASRPETNGKHPSDARRGTVSALGMRGEEVSVHPEGNQVMIRTIPPDIGRVKLEEVSFVALQTYSPLTELL